VIRRLLATNAPAATLLIRVMVAVVFASEGIQKFLYAEQLGVGRFIRIGIPYPEVMAPLVGVVEIVSGAMVLAGLGTRAAATRFG
jgi:putative oxidoreductase